MMRRSIMLSSILVWGVSLPAFSEVYSTTNDFGCIFSLTTAKSRFECGESIPIELCILNRGNSVVYSRDIANLAPFRLHLRKLSGDDGRVHKSSLGIAMQNYKEFTPSRWSVSISPGETVCTSWDIGALFDMSIPADYTLAVECRLDAALDAEHEMVLPLEGILVSIRQRSNVMTPAMEKRMTSLTHGIYQTNNQGVVMGIDLPKDTFAMGERIPLLVTMHNGSVISDYIMDTSISPIPQIHVTEMGRTNDVIKTSLGNALPDPKTLSIVGGWTKSMVSPGESVAALWPVNAFYDVSMPGLYELSVCVPYSVKGQTGSPFEDSTTSECRLPFQIIAPTNRVVRLY